MKTKTLRAVLIAAAMLVVLLAASGTASPSTSASCAPPKGKVTITYAAFNADIQKGVNLFNQTHPNIHVKFELVQKNYQTLLNQLKGHKAPDLAMVEFQELPTLLLQKGLTDISQCAPVKNLSKQFPAWTLNQVGVGTHAVYAVPQDVEPLAMVYRTDIFNKYNLPVPTTWAQYKADALQLTKDDPSVKMTEMSSGATQLLYGLMWQAGARPFVYQGNSFIFDMDSPQIAKVSDFWDSLISAGAVNTSISPFTPAEYTAWDTGTLATEIVPAYMPDVMKDNSPKSSGDWAVAPIPQWTAGANADGNDGGSSVAVMAGSKQLYADAVFADWLDTNQAGLETFFGGVDPELAATSLYNKMPIVHTPYPYFNGQKVLETYYNAAKHVNENFQWAPNEVTVDEDLQNNLTNAFNGSSSIFEAFQKTQTQAAADLRKQGVKVITK